MDTIDTNPEQELERLRALNKRLHYYAYALVALWVASVAVNLLYLS